MTRYTLATVGLLTAGLAAVAFPWAAVRPTADNPTGYQTLDRAITTRVQGSSGGTAATGYLGVTVEADSSGRPTVELVQSSSPAASAGVKPGDLVTHVGGRQVATPESFREWVQSYPPGEPVKLGLVRDGEPVEVTARLAATSRPLRAAGGGGPPRAYVGVTLGEVQEGGGARVESVSAGSPAATAGLKEGDFVLKANGTALTRQATLRDLLDGKRPGDTLTLAVRRDKKDLELRVTLGNPPTQGSRGQVPAPSLWTRPRLRLAVIGVQFADTNRNDRSTPESLEKLFCSSDPGSLSDYFHEVSVGRLRIEGKAFAWVEVGKKRGEYIQGSGTSNKTALLAEALDKLTARDGADALKDFDAIAFVYAGTPYRTNAGAVYYPHAGTVSHQRRPLPYFIGPEGGNTLSPLAVFAKPAGMMLGLPNLAARIENIGSEGLGPWCVTSDVPRSGKPPHPSAWCKERMGWLRPVVIDPTVPQRLILSPVNGSATECVKVLVRPDGSEYFLLENRRKTGFDSDLPAEGLFIWRVVNGRPMLEESHGVEGPAGPTVHLRSVPYPSPANNTFTPNTIPSSRSPLGGGLPVYLTDIRRLPDGRVSFQVGYVYD